MDARLRVKEIRQGESECGSLQPGESVPILFRPTPYLFLRCSASLAGWPICTHTRSYMGIPKECVPWSILQNVLDRNELSQVSSSTYLEMCGSPTLVSQKLLRILARPRGLSTGSTTLRGGLHLKFFGVMPPLINKPTCFRFQWL